MHGLGLPQVTGCMLVSSSDYNTLFTLTCLSISRFLILSIFFSAFHTRDPCQFCSAAKIKWTLYLYCSFLMHQRLQRNTKSMSSPRLKEGVGEWKDGRLVFKVGYIFNSEGLFAEQDEESNQGACEQDYHVIERIGMDFSATEDQYTRGIKSYPRSYPASIWFEEGMRSEREGGSNICLANQVAHKEKRH